MPEITLPDGSRRSYAAPPSVAEVAADIGPGLARAALAGRVGGQLVDTDFHIEKDADLAIVTARDADGLEILRHSTAHLLAQAVQELFPGAQVTIGPVIEDGFYYDFAYERGFTPEDLQRIEQRMKELAKADLPVSRETVGRDDAVEYFKSIGEHYKAEIIAGIPEDESITLYGQGDWKDLCRGPHVPSTGHLKAFKLTRTAGAYWRGDSANEQLKRIYGTAWADSKSLKAYLTRLEEAARRDHRRIGTDLDLYSIQEDAGGGLVFWHPKGARIRRVIEDFFAGGQHGPGRFPPRHTSGQQLSNPNDYSWFLRRLLLAMDDWVDDDAAPPASVYPRVADGDLVMPDDLRFPDLPGVGQPANPHLAYRAVYGPEFRTRGIVTVQPPEVISAFPVMVPRVDGDGNETGGLMMPEVAVPLATYTGWNLFRAESGPTDVLSSMQGSYIPFPRTRADGDQTGDPRHSIAERYASRAAYLGQVSAAALALVDDGYLLAEDLSPILTQAGRHWDYLMEEDSQNQP